MDFCEYPFSFWEISRHELGRFLENSSIFGWVFQKSVWFTPRNSLIIILQLNALFWMSVPPIGLCLCSKDRPNSRAVHLNPLRPSSSIPSCPHNPFEPFQPFTFEYDKIHGINSNISPYSMFAHHILSISLWISCVPVAKFCHQFCHQSVCWWQRPCRRRSQNFATWRRNSRSVYR